MTVRVVGSNWDAAVLDALARQPPPDPAPDPAPGGVVARHLHVTRVLVEVIGDDLALFLRCHGHRYTRHWRHRSDPVTAMVSWLAEYFLGLHDVLRSGPAAALASWPEAVRETRALGAGPRLVLTTQLGYAVLVPLLIEQATDRPVYPVVHDQNPAVLRMYRERLRRGRAFVLTDLTASDVRAWLDSGGILVANVDRSYPGTRRVRRLPLLGGELTVPIGLICLALRAGLEIRAMAAPGPGGRITATVSQPLPTDLDGALGEFGACLTRWVGTHPEQWMAWASLDDARLDDASLGDARLDDADAGGQSGERVIE